MSDHLIAEADRHAKALPKMQLPTTQPTHRDIAWYIDECADLKKQLASLERENAELLRQKSSQGLTLATLCDMILGEDAADRSDSALIRAAGQMWRENLEHRVNTIAAKEAKP